MKQQSAQYHREPLCLQSVGGWTAASYGRLDLWDQLGHSRHQPAPRVKLQTRSHPFRSTSTAIWVINTTLTLFQGSSIIRVLGGVVGGSNKTESVYTSGRVTMLVVEVRQDTHSCMADLWLYLKCLCLTTPKGSRCGWVRAITPTTLPSPPKFTSSLVNCLKFCSSFFKIPWQRPKD